jgi:hypothetical protein
MPYVNTREIVELGDEDEVLRLFFLRLRTSRRILVRDGSEEFVVEYQSTQISDDLRSLLSGGGPAES